MKHLGFLLLVLAAVPLGAADVRPSTVTLRGVVSAVQQDTFDTRWIWATLRTEDGAVPIGRGGPGAERGLRALIDAEISVTCRKLPFEAWRSSTACFYSIVGEPVVLQPPPDDPFVPAAARTSVHRQRRTGVVLLTGRRRFFLSGGKGGHVYVVTPQDGEPMPAPGETVTVAGFLTDGNYPSQLAEAKVRRETDVPRVALTNRVANSADIAFPQGRPSDVIPGEAFYGALVRVTGTAIRATGDDAPRTGRFTLDVGTIRLSIDASDLGEDVAGRIESGSRVEVDGLCLFEYGEGDVPVPLFRSMTVIPGSADDIRVLTPPPWWTPARLLAVIGVLLAALVALFVRNRLAAAAAALRFDERTRLAVELHDSISQNLVGATLQVDAAQDFLDRDRDRARRCLSVASRTLGSSREELRNCIWDLRSRALEEPDLNAAIRKTLQNHLNGAQLTLRFNVPRARLSENTVHDLLHIVRELVSNAIRHGHATTVAVAGAMDGGRLAFSVTDNGSGFDPARRPGVADGHFGLQGIGERVRRHKGKMDIESRPGDGTRVAIWIQSEC